MAFLHRTLLLGWIILTLSVLPDIAYGYLDPGSSSALVTAMLSIFGALIYSVQSFVYNLMGRSKNKNIFYNTKMPIIFGEGREYWDTFQPIITELMRKKIPFRYFTFDVHDKALKIDSPFMHSKLLRKNILGFSQLSKSVAPVMLATSPNIGTKNHPFERPSKVKNLVHIFHSVADISYYKKGSLDHYDSVILAGDFQINAIRTIEKKRNLKRKKLIAMGLPYLDKLYQNRKNNLAYDKKTLLVGSSWGEKGCLHAYGIGFIIELADAGYEVIIRAHPYSYQVEVDFIRTCERQTEKYKNITWDRKISPEDSMQKSSLLISDTSSLRFDYALTYEKPVISLEIPKENLSSFEADDLREIWGERATYEIGRFIKENDIKTLPVILKEMLAQGDHINLKEFGQKTIKNLGNSSEYIADYLAQSSKNARNSS